MATMNLLRLSPVSRNHRNHSNSDSRRVFNQTSVSISSQQKMLFSPLGVKLSSNPNLLERFDFSCNVSGGGGDSGAGFGNGGGGGDGGGEESGKFDSDSSWGGFDFLGIFLNGWRSRVAADPQFPFKVLMEEIVGVSSCVLGDMASRPNFGLNELDFVFSTLVVGCILNFTLMYLLAPTMGSSAASNLPALFANCPKSHMFEPGTFSLINRLGTFVYKGTVFAAVGFAAGLAGTALSNGLIKMRKKMDPNFETPNKPPPTILNSFTWALHMGLSSNLRYQTLNGAEFVLEKGLPPFVFKSSVVVLRCLNNVLGGMSFVVLARLTGAQNSEQPKLVSVAAGPITEIEKLVETEDDSGSDLPVKKHQ